MTTDSFEYQIARVRAMAHDANGESWELGGTDRDALLAVLASHRALLAALQHVEVCAACANADWSACPRGGQQALAAIAKAEGR